MRNTIWGRILMYIGLWIVIFLILCVVSIIKNWSILVAVISNEFSAIVYAFVLIGLMLYGIVMMIRGGLS